MNIGIDANEANLTVRVGVGQYAFNVIWELYRQDQKNTYHVYLKQPPLLDMPVQRENWHYHVFGPQKLWTIIGLPLRLFTQSIKLDIFWSPSHYSPRFSPVPTIPTIHDLGYLQSLDQFNSKDIYQLVNWTKHSLYKAHHIVAVSEFTKSEINRIYNIDLKKITVVPNGVGEIPITSDKDFSNVKKKFGIANPYFLYLGTLKPNKNIPFLINSFSEFLKLQSSKVHQYQLVIAGKKGWQYDSIFSQVTARELEKSVIFTDYISELEKWTLYKNAIASVLPSTYEGFGIPAIESQKSKVPVIASDIPSYREVLLDSAIIIDPTSTSSLTQAMIDIQSPPLRKKLIVLGTIQANHYTWAASAQKLIKTFNKV
ncbi:glycosyltransferase family 4 protein [Candidatus Shapirobacteria bacterium]|nr:glycosyltransferase family 4 protein [Candidatus Shapirobacteria bacterium]